MNIGKGKSLLSLLFLRVFAGFAVGFSKLSDIFGRKSVIVVAWLLFTLGSVWCGFAREMAQLYVDALLKNYLVAHFYLLTLRATELRAVQFKE